MGCWTATGGGGGGGPEEKFELPATLPLCAGRTGTGIGFLTGPGEFRGCCCCCLNDPLGSMEDAIWLCCPKLMAEGSESLLVSW